MTEKDHSYIFLKNLLELLPEVPADSILSRSLYKDERINVTLFAFAAGQELTEHTSAQPAILEFLEGEAELTLGEDRQKVEPGARVYMASNLAHSVVAKTPLVMLLTLIKDRQRHDAHAKDEHTDGKRADGYLAPGGAALHPGGSEPEPNDWAG